MCKNAAFDTVRVFQLLWTALDFTYSFYSDKMVTRRIRSEYMKKFKDPKWETYTKCYEEMLKYRLTRRLLEQTHNPWFWSGSDTDSDTGGRSPIPPSKNQVRAETGRDRAAAELEECEGTKMDRTTETVPRLPLQDEEENVSPQSAVNGKMSSI